MGRCEWDNILDKGQRQSQRPRGIRQDRIVVFVGVGPFTGELFGRICVEHLLSQRLIVRLVGVVGHGFPLSPAINAPWDEGEAFQEAEVVPAATGSVRTCYKPL